MNDTRVNLPLPPALKDRIQAAADRAGCGVSEWIRFQLRRALVSEAEEALKERRAFGEPADAEVA